MEPRLAVRLRSNKALTPYIPDAWEWWLRASGLLSRYPSIPDGLRFGFAVGLANPHISFTPPNNPSILEHASVFEEIVNKEMSKGRYIGPFGRTEIENLLGPFQTAPLSLVPKPGKPGKFRLVQNLSFPHSSVSPLVSAVNDRVDPNLFPTHYSTFLITSLLISRLPPGSEAAVRDVAEAYRTVPSHPSQWPSLVVRLAENQFAIDSSFCFGFAPSGGIYGMIGAAGTDILRFNGIGPIARWVDDHIFFRIRREHLIPFNHLRADLSASLTNEGNITSRKGRSWFEGITPNGDIEEFDEDMSLPIRDLSSASPRSERDRLFCYNLDDVNKITNQLGIPWEASKDIPFCSNPTFIGLIWDIDNRTVTLTETKRTKYLAAISEWESKRTHVLNEVQKLHGKLLHASLVFPAGRAYLTNLEAMLGIFRDSPFLPRTPPRETPNDLNWWRRTLSSTPLRPLPIHPLPTLDLRAFSDASTGVGIGITIGSRWRAWILTPNWQCDGREIGWAESIGLELLTRVILAAGASNLRLEVFGDNLGVVEAWANGRSRSRTVNGVFKRLHNILQDAHCELSVRYVPSKDNPADPPSRGLYPPARFLLPYITLPPELSPFLRDCPNPHHLKPGALELPSQHLC